MPNDIITHIGSFLKPKDLSNCLQASKIFQEITYAHTHHVTNFKYDTISDGLENMYDIIEYVKECKPKLKEHRLYFNNITIDGSNLPENVYEAIYSPNIILCFMNCSDDIMDIITSWFDDTIPKYIVFEHIYGDERFLEYKNIRCVETKLWNDNIDIVLRNHVICSVPELILVNHTAYKIIDLSGIDMSRNTILMLILAEYPTGGCRDAHKITHLYDANDEINTHFYTSLVYDNEDFKMTSRLKEIYIHNKIGLDYPFIDSLRIFPMHVTFKVQIFDNSTLALIEAINKSTRNIEYICQDDEQYLNALFCNTLFPQYRFGITTTSDYSKDSFDITDIKTVNDIYEKMSSKAKQYWYSTWLLANLHQKKN